MRMTSSKHVAVLHNAAARCDDIESFLKHNSFTWTLFPISTLEDLHKAIRDIYTAGLSVYHCTLNLFSGSVGADFVTSGVTAAMVALLLDQCNLPYTGCRSSLLNYPIDIFFMMLWYAGVPLPRFAVVDSSDAAEKAARRLRTPVRVRSTCTLLGSLDQTIHNPEALEQTLIDAFLRHGKTIAWQVSDLSESAVEVVVYGNNPTSPAAIVPTAFGGSSRNSSHFSTLCAVVGECESALVHQVLHCCGAVSLTFNRSKDAETEQPTWVVEDFCLNPPVWQQSWMPFTSAELPAPLSHHCFTDAFLRDAGTQHLAPIFQVKLHEDSRKGYHLCAARTLKKGEVVFADEGRSFAMVTRPHVERYWNDRLKKTFTEYAWPLDSDGHLYAIWEEDPLRWRPINHSCDPNCIFDAPHSLNVVAAREIAAGEDLNMDYATFCDETMKPFQCICGAPCCRGLIAPDAASLMRYGDHSWLRAVPPPSRPLV